MIKYLLPFLPLKRLLSFLLSLSIALPALAQQASSPQWDEFCPFQYLIAQVGPVSGGAGVGSFLLATYLPIVGFPVIISKNRKRARETQRNYWASRRHAFENELALCENTTSDKALCFFKIREIEEQKNAAYQAHRDSVALRRTVNSLR